jgi:uncharacterized membrane protein YozB (DUF420 family)
MRGQDLPSINAALNMASAVLLSTGYVAVRHRRLRLHIICMLAALTTSTLFLTSYLYYHFGVLDGRPTPFTGQGWVRPAYFAILLSHTLLAIIVAPMACVTAYLGLRGRFGNHRRIARWTFPLWLYVSLTGVAVYLMLYQLYPSAYSNGR